MSVCDHNVRKSKRTVVHRVQKRGSWPVMSQNPSFWISPKTQDGNSAVVTGGSIFASPISAAMLKYIIATWNDCIEGQIAIGRTCLIPANATQKDFVLAVTKLGELTLADLSRQPKFFREEFRRVRSNRVFGRYCGRKLRPPTTSN